CAADFIPAMDLSGGRDFSVAGDGPAPADLAVGDLGGGDLASPPADLAGHDLAAPDLLMPDLLVPDLAQPLDLAPFPMCDLMPADDAGSVHLRVAGVGAAGALYVARFDGSWGA